MLLHHRDIPFYILSIFSVLVECIVENDLKQTKKWFFSFLLLLCCSKNSCNTIRSDHHSDEKRQNVNILCNRCRTIGCFNQREMRNKRTDDDGYIILFLSSSFFFGYESNGKIHNFDVVQTQLKNGEKNYRHCEKTLMCVCRWWTMVKIIFVIFFLPWNGWLLAQILAQCAPTSRFCVYLCKFLPFLTVQWCRTSTKRQIIIFTRKSCRVGSIIFTVNAVITAHHSTMNHNNLFIKSFPQNFVDNFSTFLLLERV